MTIEQQCVSLELAKKLKELGVKQESLFYWKTAPGYCEIVTDNYYDSYPVSVGRQKHGAKHHSAFTVGELGEMLPDHFYTQKSGVDFFVDCKDFTHGAYHHYEFASTEADARAKMLIFLLENKLMMPPH